MEMAYNEMKKQLSGQRVAYRAGETWDWSSLGAIAGLAGGLVAVLFGSVLTAISWLTGTGSHVQTLGTVLLFLTIPLLVFGAQCLDLIERKKERAKEARRRDN